MLKNNNQAAVKRIAKRSMKSNRTRNMFTVLAIILTTFMFTTVFSVGFSLAKNMNIMFLRQQGTKAKVYLANPTDEQIAQAKTCAHLHAAGVQIAAGAAQSPENAEKQIVLSWYDKTEFEKNFSPAISDIKGAYPEAENEIMLSKAALGALGIDTPRLGADIVLRVDGEEKHFCLSGWFTDYGISYNGSQAFISRAYTDSLGLTVEKDGRLSMSAKLSSQAKLVMELEEKVTLKEGQEIESGYDVQSDNVSNAVIVAAAVGLIGLIIVFSGYLLIYNVMYISVTKDIRFYGMLKTVGTSPRQIHNIVAMQAFRLSAVGIPLGILLGTLISFVVVPYAMEMFGSGRSGAMPTDISFHPLIYFGTVLFGLFTVAVSCRKPSKAAAKVSPVEALKYNGRNSEKIRPKQSTDGGKLFKMAWRNVFREKKRALLVFASLFMGTMAFLSTNAFVSSMKLENYVDYYLPNDCTIYTRSAEDGKFDGAAQKLTEDISKIDGVTHVSMNRSADADIAYNEDIFRAFIENEASDEAAIQSLLDFYKENSYSAPVIGVSSEMMKRYNQKARRKIDIDRFEKGEICFVGYVNSQKQSDRVVGKRITLIDNGSGNSVSMEVGVCPVFGDRRGINTGHYWSMQGTPACILVSQSVIDRLTDNPGLDNIVVDCEAEAESRVMAQIRELSDSNPCVLQYEIKSEVAAEFKSSMGAMKVLTAGISAVLILIGIINFINVMLTGVFTRRNELAVMESVGMTKKQIRKMLMFEGIYYGAVTLALIFTLGNGIVYVVARLAQKVADYAVFYYPWLLMLAIAAVILLICTVVPAAVYRMVSRESVTERLRESV